MRLSPWGKNAALEHNPASGELCPTSGISLAVQAGNALLPLAYIAATVALCLMLKTWLRVDAGPQKLAIKNICVLCLVFKIPNCEDFSPRSFSAGISCVGESGESANMTECLRWAGPLPPQVRGCRVPCKDDCTLTAWSKFSDCAGCGSSRSRKRSLTGKGFSRLFSSKC